MQDGVDRNSLGIGRIRGASVLRVKRHYRTTFTRTDSRLLLRKASTAPIALLRDQTTGIAAIPF